MSKLDVLVHWLTDAALPCFGYVVVALILLLAVLGLSYPGGSL